MFVEVKDEWICPTFSVYLLLENWEKSKVLMYVRVKLGYRSDVATEATKQRKKK